MGLPGHRRTSSHKRRRAAHFALVPMQVTVCEKCKSPVLSHRACKVCGWYKGRVAIANADKRLARLAKHAHAGHAHAEETVTAKKADEKKEKKSVKKETKKTAVKKPAAKKATKKPSV